MKKFEIVVTTIVVLFIGVTTIGMFAGDYLREQAKREKQQIMMEANRELLYQKHLQDVMFGKYADSISDAMLRDFYPEAADLDSLRYRLKDTFESHTAAEEDGLI